MAWFYAFVERRDQRYAKLGIARDHYHDRFSKTQQCNPIPMEIAATWRFPTLAAAKMCETEIKRGTILPKWGAGGPEWFRTSLDDIHANVAFTKLLSDLDGTYHTPTRFSGSFLETLNLGARDQNGSVYRPHLYLISEEPSTGACKLALSCYNWPTVVAHYMTYNPRSLSIAGRWSFGDEIAGKAFIEKLTRQCMSRRINTLGWFRIDVDELIAITSNSGAKAYERTSPIDDRVHYTKHRVPLH